MRKMIRKAAAICLAVALSIPAFGLTAEAGSGKTQVDLTGKYVTSYKAKTGGEIADIDKLIDGDLDGNISINRNDGHQFIAYAVYDAGEGETFSFNNIEVSGENKNDKNKPEIIVFGTNNPRIASETPTQASDYTTNGYQLFQSEFELKKLSDNLQAGMHPVYFGGYRYLVISFSNWEYTNISEYRLYNAYYGEIGDVLGISDVAYKQGTSGKIQTSSFGQVVNGRKNTTGLFGLKNGDPLENLSYVDCIDNGTDAKYKGNVTADIKAETEGEYRVSILGCTNQNRKYSVTVNDSQSYTTNENIAGKAGAISTNPAGTTTSYLNYYFVDVHLNKGVNRFVITGAETAPNFVKMIVTEIPAPTWLVTVQEEGKEGEGTVLEVDQGKMVACHSDHEVAWTIDGEVLAIGTKFTYIPTGDVTIVAKEVAPEMTAQGIVTDGKVAGQKFTVTFGESVTGNVTYTFVTTDRQAAEVTVPVNEFAGNTVEYTITGAGNRDIQYVIARKEKAE